MNAPDRAPPGSATRPLRVLVIGSSAAFMVEPPRRDRTDGTYSEWLEQHLADAGVNARVELDATWFGQVVDVRPRYERLRSRLPDVVVINFGMAECQPRVVPTWLVRHFTTWDLGSSAPARAYRRHVAPRLWRLVRGWQRLGARLVGQRTHRVPPRRFTLEVQGLVTRLRMEVRPLTLVVDIDPPGPRIVHWLPGIARRVERYNRLLEDVVADIGDDEVRFVAASKTIDADSMDVLLPDGFHRSSEGHRTTARLLAAEILEWLRHERQAGASAS